MASRLRYSDAVKLPPNQGELIRAVATDVWTGDYWSPAERVRILAALRRLRGHLSADDIAWVRLELVARLHDDALDPRAAPGRGPPRCSSSRVDLQGRLPA
jgi:hypothetical protein